MDPELLAKLNPSQLAAVTHEGGPLLIVAGAGTGKTTVLINRLAYLVLEKKLSTEEILIMTFTEKATAEMEERADKILPYGYFDLWINTFHGFCERILREHALDIGLSPDFKLLSTTEEWMLIKNNLTGLGLDYYRPLGNPTKFIHELIKHFSRLKDENVSSQEYLDYAEGLEQDEDGMLSGAEETEMEVARVKELARAYHGYNQLLLDEKYLDFGDLIVYTLRLFKERPNILAKYRQQFKYIMVDEFQDTNWAQYELVKLLSRPDNNLVVVGDDNQSIYKFRGASLSNIMQFKDDYPNTQEIILNDNYRSGQNILDAAHAFIKHNDPNTLEAKLGISKKLKSHSAAPGAVIYYNLPTELEEVAQAVNRIEEIKKTVADTEWSDFAILVRANDTADKYLKELKRRGLPHQFVSLKGLYYKPVILDLIAYFKLLDNYHESSAIFRVLNMDIFRVPYQDLVQINKVARAKVWSIYETLQNINVVSGVTPETVAAVNRLLGFLEKHSTLVKKERPSKILLSFLYDTGYLKDLDHDRDQEIFSYLNQFFRKIKNFEANDYDVRLKDFMAVLDLEREAGDSGALRLVNDDYDTIKVMTIHSAKGLEFKYVFLVDLVDKKFPTISRGDKIIIPRALAKEKNLPDKDTHLEEERRLFYVAVTRAKQELYLLAAKDYGGAREKKPSRFIAELGINPEISSAQKIADELLTEMERLFAAPADERGGRYPLPERFSFSQLAAYDSCPLQYKFAFVLGIPAPQDKPSLIFGKVIHDVLKDFLAPLLPGQSQVVDLFGQVQAAADNLSREKLFSLYEKIWQPDGYSDQTEREKYNERGKKCLDLFLKHLETNGYPHILFIEKDFNFKIGDESIKGKIDRVDEAADGSLEIVDYKTGNPKDKLEWKDKKQLILYQLFLEEALSRPVSRLSYYYLENGTQLSFVSKPAEKDKLRQEIMAEIQAIRSLDFTPSPEEHTCQFCDFNTICEFRKN
ncbi:MAG TPA: UvrD-helicase domain-containing protein [bacterium]|nr:UvrD-helicase domain-containing protein [bacterium]HPT29355.1 UvrD-helicase domain-containing protein [bacterium]